MNIIKISIIIPVYGVSAYVFASFAIPEAISSKTGVSVGYVSYEGKM